jgi:uncharacterized RDD family membrane protein YckC
VSTLPSIDLYPSWKQEVNRRVAAHKSRKNAPAEDAATHAEARMPRAGRAAQAAARVAARYANAPSYSQVLAEEARAAMRAAEAAQMAAEDAHAAVQMVLDELEAATSDASEAHPAIEPYNLSETSSIGTSSETRLQMPQEASGGAVIEWHDMTLPTPDGKSDANEPAQHAAANLIQFPREMVATRKLRPRRIEGPLAEHEAGPQLSIFEVDPGVISTQAAAVPEIGPAAPEWMRRDSPAAALEPQPREKVVPEPAVRASESVVIDLAPVSRRLLSIVVDGALTLAAFLVVVMLATWSGAVFSNLRVAEVCGVLMLLIVTAGYQTAFFSRTKSTPGMWYAGIGLCTLDGRIPVKNQRYARLIGLLLSVLPMGLGLAWALFDEDRLTWHDRLSGTYLRMR